MKNDSKTEERIKDFLAIEKMAIFGMSRDTTKFGNRVYKNMTAKGYKLFPIHPVQEEIEGIKCFKSIDDLPEKVEGAVMVIPPPKTEKALIDVARAGIKMVWMQPGAESEEGIKYCEENGISLIYEDCVMVRSASANPFG
ncbi:MAG: CoA-binding protein [Nitrospinota bacterium]|nr:CoA-binding protein [Nitrospinota bacterium]